MAPSSSRCYPRVPYNRHALKWPLPLIFIQVQKLTKGHTSNAPTQALCCKQRSKQYRPLAAALATLQAAYLQLQKQKQEQLQKQQEKSKQRQKQKAKADAKAEANIKAKAKAKNKSRSRSKKQNKKQKAKAKKKCPEKPEKKRNTGSELNTPDTVCSSASPDPGQPEKLHCHVEPDRRRCPLATTVRTTVVKSDLVGAW